MPADFDCRRAAASDALCLSVLATQVFLDTYATQGINADLSSEVTTVLSRQSFQVRLASSAVELFVAEVNGYMVGFIDLDPTTACPIPMHAGLEVARLYVQRPFQRGGIGRALMALAEDRARAKGLGALWLTAWVGNHRARSFYEALGYQDVGATRYFIEGQGYENRVLVKALPARAA